MRLEGVPAEIVPAAWKRTHPFIEKLISRTWGEVDIASIYKDLISGQMQLWHIVNDDDTLQAIWITEISTEQTGIKVCSWFGCAGSSSKEWLHLRVEIENWAREQGATIARLAGRKGWEKLLPDYKPVYVEMIKEL